MNQASIVSNATNPIQLSHIVRFTPEQCTGILAQRKVSWRTQFIIGKAPEIVVVSQVSGETLATLVDGDSLERELRVANWCVQYLGVPSPLLTDAQQTRERIESLERHNATLQAQLEQVLALVTKGGATAQPAPEQPSPEQSAPEIVPAVPVVAAGTNGADVEDPAEDERQKVAAAMAALAPTAPVIVQPAGDDDEEVPVEKRPSGRRK